jgi:hypothetical protein
LATWLATSLGNICFGGIAVINWKVDLWDAVIIQFFHTMKAKRLVARVDTPGKFPQRRKACNYRVATVATTLTNAQALSINWFRIMLNPWVLTPLGVIPNPWVLSSALPRGASEPTLT